MEKKNNNETNNEIKNNNKKSIILVVIILLIITIVSVLINKKTIFNSKSNLDINYGNGKVIELTNIKGETPYKNSIKVTNNTNKDLVYSVTWTKVSNSFKEQNKVLYTLDTHDAGALFIGKSQLPVADSTLSDKVEIKAKTTHTYDVTVYFNGDSSQEQNNKFTGSIEINQVKK